MNSRSTLGL